MKGVKAIEIENRKENIGIMQVASISAFSQFPSIRILPCKPCKCLIMISLTSNRACAAFYALHRYVGTKLSLWQSHFDHALFFALNEPFFVYEDSYFRYRSVVSLTEGT